MNKNRHQTTKTEQWERRQQQMSDVSKTLELQSRLPPYDTFSRPKKLDQSAAAGRDVEKLGEREQGVVS